MKLPRHRGNGDSSAAGPGGLGPVDPGALAPDATHDSGGGLLIDEAPTSQPVVVVAAVNLLPDTYAKRAAVKRAKAFAAGAIVVALLVALFAWLIAGQRQALAQESLDAATAQRAQLQAEAARYSDVPKVFASVAAAEQQLELAMGNEVRWSFFLNDLALTMPAGVSLDSLQVSSPAPGAGQAAAAPSSANASAMANGASGAGVPSLGAMNVSAKAFTYNTVANWLDSLAKLPTLADPYVGSIAAGSEEGTDIVTYSSTASITSEALSQRYAEQEVAP